MGSLLMEHTSAWFGWDVLSPANGYNLTSDMNISVCVCVCVCVCVYDLVRTQGTGSVTIDIVYLCMYVIVYRKACTVGNGEFTCL